MHVNLEASAHESGSDMSGRRVADDASNAALPLAYGSDQVMLMVRDPTWAYAYWDISLARVQPIVGTRGGGQVMLRLLAVPSGEVVAEHEVSVEHGRHDAALPESHRAFIAEVAMVHDGRRHVLASSDVVQAPRNVTGPLTTPVFVSRADQLAALADRRTLEHWDAPTPRTIPTVASSGFAPSGSIGSEGRLLMSELRATVRVGGSEGRLAAA